MHTYDKKLEIGSVSSFVPLNVNILRILTFEITGLLGGGELSHPKLILFLSFIDSIVSSDNPTENFRLGIC